MKKIPLYNNQRICFILINYGRYRVGNGSYSSSSVQEEVRSIEEEYGLNLHQSWRIRLPNDLLIVTTEKVMISSLTFLRQIAMKN